jgi:DNA repair exonuclease SbcCD ATPase subunit
MKRVIIVIGVVALLSIVNSGWAAGEREIIEKLSRLEAGQEAIHKRIDDVNANLTKRLDDVRSEISDLKEFMLWGYGVTFAGIFALIGFVLWDRRTALAPTIKKSKELEEREEKIEKALKEYAEKEPRLKEILKNLGIL